MKPYFLDHLVIVVKDIQTTTKFYTSFLDEPEHIDNNQVVFKIGETKIFFGLPYKDYMWHDKDKYGLNHIAFGG